MTQTCRVYIGWTFPHAAVAAGVDFVIVYLVAESSNNTVARPLKIDLSPGVDVTSIDGDATAATNLKQSSLAIATGTVVDDPANSATAFEIDTTLGAKAEDYFGSSSGGMVLAWVSGTTNEWQTRRVVDFDTASNFITLEEACDAEPVAADAFVLLGRITELS